MDIHSNLEYLCRVCAANTKGKNSVAECVYILKTAGLKDKLDKFLYLKISENDSLPKVLCKSCFRQVEATASLSKIAKHTQQVFRDFLLSNLPKGPSESTSNSEFTSSDFMGNRNTYEKSKIDEIVTQPMPANSLVQIQPPLDPTTLLPPVIPQPSTTASRKDEVIVNVSVADPLTRDNQQKMISNSQRRQSFLLESRYTPKSIAQKQIANPAAVPRLIAPKLNQSVESINVTNNPTATAPTLNFYPVKTQQQTKQQQPPKATQITTFSSGGYVIGRFNTVSSVKEEPKKLTIPLTPSADNILKQKRKNLVKALNNIKANNPGQVSLLKSSQQKQIDAMQYIVKTPSIEVVNQVAEDELPEKIIIAAPKNKTLTEKLKKEPLNLSSKIPASIAQHPNTTAITGVVQQQLEQPSVLTNTPPKPAFPEDILLGRAIRDVDLLKLILKALKWPVNKLNMELQLQRLKNSKFTDIMSDPNLLQDTDLTQLLGPYLTPVLLAAQALQQQQQQILNNTTLNNQNVIATLTTQPKMTALEAAQAEINKSIPYKLPPETSVQLVPATPEEIEATQSPILPTFNTTTSTSVTLKRDRKKDAKVAGPQKKQRKSAIQKTRDSIVISDEEEVSTEEEAPKKSRQRGAKSTSNIQFELNPSFVSQFNLLSGSGSNEADELMALLLKQKAALLNDKKVQRRRRNSVSNLITLPPSEFDSLIDLDDDIVLMEPVSTTSSSESYASNQDPQQQKTDVTNTFIIPSVPLITRPIIKRRKTVIHSPKNRFDLSTELKRKEPIPTSSSSLLKTKEKLMEETINQVAMGNIINADNMIQESPYNTIITEKVPAVTPVELPSSKLSQQRKVQNKSALGQQLLEAICLQKTPSKIKSNPQNEASRSAILSNPTSVLPNSKQIRTALKKSLKQAQEQQLQKKIQLSSSGTNTVIQDADSTTKPAVKEILVVDCKGNKTDNCSSIVDVEDQIDKVTLMVRNNDENSCEQSTTKTNSSSNAKDEVRNTADKEKVNEDDENIAENIGAAAENEHFPKEDAAKISSSTAAVSNTSDDATVTIKDEIITPKRRGRKRLVDKQIEQEAAEANEREKDNKAVNILSDGSRTFDKSREEESETTNNNKNEEETENYKTSGRPARQSKTQSKYYKGPDKPTQGRRSLPSRTTRNR